MRIALAGVGHWHAAMHREAAHQAEATITGVWDEDADVAARFARENGLETQASPEALARARPDLVVLMGRPTGLVERAISLVDAGLAVMLEKPASPSMASSSCGERIVRRVPIASRAFAAVAGSALSGRP